MPTFKIGDVVKLPFPYTDKNVQESRPALVVGIVDDRSAISSLLWVVMITSRKKNLWVDDLEIADLATAGLPSASVIRPAKIATVDQRLAEIKGNISQELLGLVRAKIQKVLG